MSDEFKQLSLENQRLTAAVERIRRERDETEARLAASQLRVTELESKLRQQAHTISDMEAEKRVSAPQLKAESVDIIEISDDEEDKKRVLACSVGLQDTAPPKCSPPKTSPMLSTVEDASPSTRPVSLKRPRSESPLLPKSESRPQGGHVGSASPTSPTPVKRQKKSSSRPTLTQAAIDSYLLDTPNLVITPPPLSDLYVSRAFLSTHYGGTAVHFVVDFNREGKGRKAVFPELSLNPFLPKQPGKAGLIFASRREITDGQPWAVFSKDKPSGPAVWRYMGDYVNEVCGHPSPEEVQAQDDRVTQSWAEHIHKNKKWKVYAAMRARIALRKAGRDITDAAVEKEVQGIQEGRGLPVKKTDIIDALKCGDEWIDIVRMKCVSYDHEFAAELARKSADPPPIPKSSRLSSSRLPKKSNTASKGKGRSVASSRRTYDSDADADDNFDVESEDDDAEWQPEGRQEVADMSTVRVSPRRPRPKRRVDDEGALSHPAS